MDDATMLESSLLGLASALMLAGYGALAALRGRSAVKPSGFAAWRRTMAAAP